MKIFPCATTSAPKTEEYPLSWEDIKKVEGVYKSTYPSVRLLVVHGPVRDAVVLYYSPEFGLQKAAPNWELFKFKKTDEKVYLDIK